MNWDKNLIVKRILLWPLAGIMLLFNLIGCGVSEEEIVEKLQGDWVSPYGVISFKDSLVIHQPANRKAKAFVVEGQKIRIQSPESEELEQFKEEIFILNQLTQDSFQIIMSNNPEALADTITFHRVKPLETDYSWDSLAFIQTSKLDPRFLLQLTLQKNGDYVFTRSAPGQKSINLKGTLSSHSMERLNSGMGNVDWNVQPKNQSVLSGEDDFVLRVMANGKEKSIRFSPYNYPFEPKPLSILVGKLQEFDHWFI